MANKPLTEEDIKWAYENWCLGYSQAKLAEELDVDEKTICRTFQRRKLKKKKPPLKPPPNKYRKCP